MQLQNATKQRENVKTQLGESRDELRKHKEAHSLLQKNLLEIQHQADNSKEELAAKLRLVEKLETSNKDLVSKVDDLKEQMSKQRMSFELHATQSKGVETELNLSQSKVTELDTSLQSLKTEKDDLQRELFAVSCKLATMEETNRKSLDRITELDMENSRMRDTIARLESEMFAQGRRVSQLEPTYSQAKDEIEQLTIKLEESSIKINQLESSCETAVRERDELREELTLSERRMTETRSMLQKTEDASNELEQKMAAMKSQMFKYEGQMESASKQKANLKAELEEDRSKVTRLKAELARMKSRYDEFQRNSDFKQKESSNKDKIIEDLRASVAAYELKTESVLSEVSKLQAQMEITEEEKRELQEEALEAQKRVRDAAADNRQNSEENERLNLEIQSFYKRLSELQASFNTCEHEKFDFQHQAMALQQKVSKLEAEIDESVKQRSACEVRVQEYAATDNAVTQEITLLKSQLLEQQCKNDDLRKNIAEREASSKHLQEKLNALNVDFEACREELKNVKEMREMSEKEKKMLHNELRIKQEEHSRALGFYETTLKRKEQLEVELNMVQKQMANIELTLKRSVAADKARELDHERSRSTELVKQLATYKSKVSSLESLSELTKNDIQGVLDELEEAENKMSILKQELEETVVNKEEREQKLSILETRNSELEQEVLVCRQIKDKSEQELLIMRTRVAKYGSQIETIQEQRAQLKEQLDANNAKLICDKDHIMRLESQVIEEKKIKETINKAIIRKDQLVEELQMKMRSAEAELEKAKSELMTIRVTNEGLRAEKGEYEERLASHRKKLEQRETEVFALRDSVVMLEQDISTSKLKIVSLEAQLSNLQLEKDDYKTQWDGSQSGIAKLKTDLKVCHSQIQDKERTCETLRLEIREKETALEKAINDKVALETEVSALQQDLDSMKVNYERSQSRAKDLEDSLDEANASISRIELSSLCNESGELERSSDEKIWEAETLYKHSQDRERSLRQKIDDYRIKIKRLEAENKNTQQENLESGRENSLLQKKLHEYELLIDKCEQEKRTLKEELVALHSKVSDLEVKYDYEIREKDSVKRQLESVLQRVATSREEFLENDKQLIVQRIGADAMKKEMDEKVVMIDQLKASKLYLEESTESLKNSLAASREERERMKVEKERLQQEILCLESSSTEYETRIQKLAHERDRIKLEHQSALAKIASLEHQLMEQNREKESLCGKVEEWKNNSLIYQERNVTADEHTADLEGSINILKTEAMKKDADIRELQGRNAKLEIEADSFKKKLYRVEKENRELAEQYRSLETRKKSLLRLETGEKETSLLQEKITNLEREVMIQKRKIVELEASSREFVEKEGKLQENLYASRAEVSKWESKCSMIQARKNEIEQDLITLQKEFTPLKDDHRHSVVQLETVHGEMQEARMKILKLEMEVNSADNARLQLEQRVQEYIVMLKNRDDELLTVQRSLQEARLLLEHKGVTRDEKGSTDRLEKENQKLEKDIFVLRQELNSTQCLLTAATRERDEACKEVFKMKRVVTEVQGKLNASQQEILELQSSVTGYQRKMTTSDEGFQKAIIEQITLKTQLDDANKKVAYNKEEFFETQRELSSLRGLVENYKKELAKNDSLHKEQGTKIRLLEDELRSCKLTIACGSNDYNNINQELAKLKLHLDEKDKCISVTEENMKRLLQENSKLRFEMSDVQALESKHKYNFNESKHKTECLQEEIISLRQKMSYMDAQNSAKEEELQDCRKELLAFKRTNFGFKSKYESLQRQTRELQAELSSSKAKLSALQHDESKNGEHVSFITRTVTDEAIEENNSSLIWRNEEYVREISRLERKVLDLESKFTAVSKQKDKLECEVIWRARRIEDLEERILKDTRQDTDENNLELKVTALEQELTASKNTITWLQKDRDSCEDKIKSAEERLFLAEQKALEMESAYRSSQERCDSEHKKLLEAHRRLSVQASPRRETFTTNLRILDDELQGHLRQENELKRLIDEARMRNGNLRDELVRNENNTSKSEVLFRESVLTSSLQNENDVLKKELSQCRDDYHRTYTEKQEIAAEFHNLQLQIAHWETSYHGIKRENDDLHFQLTELQNRYDQLKDSSHTIKQEIRYVGSATDGSHVTEQSTGIQQLMDEKGRLSGEVASLNLLLSTYKEKLDSLHLEKVQLHDKLEESKRKVFNLEQANHTLTTEKRRLEHQVAIAPETNSKKLEEYSHEKESAKMFELRIELEQMSRERDHLQHMLDLHKSRDDYDKCMQLERVHAQNLAQKESIIDGLRSETTSLQLEVGRLRQEQSLNQAEHGELKIKYMDVLKARDSLQSQVMEYKLKSVNHTSLENENYIDGFQREINEKNVVIDNLRTESEQLQAGFETAQRELVEKKFICEKQALETEHLTKEVEALKVTLTENAKEYGSLKLKLNDVCKERDFLFKNKCSLEYDLSASKRKASEAQNLTITSNSKKDQELSIVVRKLSKMEGDFNQIKQQNETMKFEMEQQMKTELWSKQECIYELEKETRKLKAENDYHQKIMDKKNANLSQLRSQILSWQKEVEKLEKELYVAKEAYEKSDRRMKEIFNFGHELLTVEDLRSLISASPVLSMRSISVAEQSITGRKLTGDHSLDLSNIYPLDSFSTCTHNEVSNAKTNELQF